MWLIILAAVVAAPFAALVLAQHLRVQRLRHRASAQDVGAWVGTLLRSYAPGSVLVAEPNGRDGFIQFALTQRGRDGRTLEFGLPETAWSAAAMRPVQDLLDAAGIPWGLEEGQRGHAIRRFLRAELRGTPADVLQRAGALIPRIAAALGHPAHQTYRVALLGGESPAYVDEVADQLERIPMRGRTRERLKARYVARLRNQARRP